MNPSYEGLLALSKALQHRDPQELIAVGLALRDEGCSTRELATSIENLLRYQSPDVQKFWKNEIAA